MALTLFIYSFHSLILQISLLWSKLFRKRRICCLILQSFGIWIFDLESFSCMFKFQEPPSVHEIIIQVDQYGFFLSYTSDLEKVSLLYQFLLLNYYSENFFSINYKSLHIYLSLDLWVIAKCSFLFSLKIKKMLVAGKVDLPGNQMIFFAFVSTIHCKLQGFKIIA